MEKYITEEKKVNKLVSVHSKFIKLKFERIKQKWKKRRKRERETYICIASKLSLGSFVDEAVNQVLLTIHTFRPYQVICPLINLPSKPCLKLPIQYYFILFRPHQVTHPPLNHSCNTLNHFWMLQVRLRIPLMFLFVWKERI